LARWNDLETARPDIAARGRELIYQHGVPLGYLATKRADGGLRIHPFCPVIVDGGIYGLILPTSPKCKDLEANSQFALHSFPVEDRDDEFMLAGTAQRITESATIHTVETAYHATGASSSGTETVFEFLPDRALLSTYTPRADGPSWPPKYDKWRPA